MPTLHPNYFCIKFLLILVSVHFYGVQVAHAKLQPQDIGAGTWDPILGACQHPLCARPPEIVRNGDRKLTEYYLKMAGCA